MDQTEFGLRFPLMISSVYHTERERFFMFLARFSNGAQSFLGASAVGALTVDAIPYGHAMGIVLGTVSAFLGVLLLVWDPIERAREHREFRVKYGDLLACLEEQETINTRFAREMKAEMAKIDAIEPPQMHAKIFMAQNQVTAVLYLPEDAANHYVQVYCWERLFSNWWPFSAQYFAERSHKRKPAKKAAENAGV